MIHLMMNAVGFAFDTAGYALQLASTAGDVAQATIDKLLKGFTERVLDLWGAFCKNKWVILSPWNPRHSQQQTQAMKMESVPDEALAPPLAEVENDDSRGGGIGDDVSGFAVCGMMVVPIAAIACDDGENDVDALLAEDAASVTASVSTSSGSRGSRSSRRGGKRGRNKTNKRRASHQFRGVSGAAPVVTGS